MKNEQKKESKRVSFFTTNDDEHCHTKSKKSSMGIDVPGRISHPHSKRPLLEYIDKDDTSLIIPYIEQIDEKPKNKKTDEKQKIKDKFDKLYGLAPDFRKKYKTLKNDKESTLSDHQKKLLGISTNLSKDHVLKLYTAFKYLRADSETIQPLPPINFDIIYKHSLKESEKRKVKDKRSLKTQLFHKEKLDEFELEMMKITKSKFNKIKKEDPTMYKIYENLPEHVVDALYKNKALH